jgi:hypothetical protein
MKWTDRIDITTVPDPVLYSEVGRRNAARRTVKAGGRPKSTDRCPCGKATRRQVEQRKHKCPVDRWPPIPPPEP